MSNSYPNTFRSLQPENEPERPHVFEPALLHFPRAFRLGEPSSTSYHERLEWERVRAEVRTHLLGLIAHSRWRDHLILRGSLLMQVWFGPEAREPKDIDWVFRPKDVKLNDAMCNECFDEITALVRNQNRTQNAEILIEQIASDDIWTYERAAGRRLVFPYRSDGLQREIQMDIVFEEEIYETPLLTSILLPEGKEISVWTVSPELSLAWKLLWLVNDSHPQGKDLYDATLLAENTRLPYSLLRRVFDGDEWYKKQEISIDTFKEPYIDWDNFKLDFPWVEGKVEDWTKRLIAAISPTFA